MSERPHSALLKVIATLGLDLALKLSYTDKYDAYFTLPDIYICFYSGEHQNKLLRANPTT